MGLYVLHIECDYPTFFDSASDQCVQTCPQGYYGNVSTTRNCTTSEFRTIIILAII